MSSAAENQTGMADAAQGEATQDATTYKDLLDKAAHEARAPPSKDEPEPTVHPIVEKVSQYVPESVGKMLGIQKEESPVEKKDPGLPSGPPDRPHHDTQIEEFVRDQHRSVKGQGLEDV